MAELCFHRFVHFHCVPIYIFGFHHKQCASKQKYFTSFVKFTSQLFSSVNESLKEGTHLLLLRDGSLVTLHTFVMRISLNKSVLLMQSRVVRLSLCLCVFVSVCLLVCLPACLSLCLLVCLSIYMCSAITQGFLKSKRCTSGPLKTIERGKFC